MGKIYSKLTRPVRLFNIENRAEKIISQKKPVAAPRYKYVEKQKELMDKVNPSFMEEQSRKNMQLDQRLKDVFVTSVDPQKRMRLSEDSKSLPQNRKLNIDEDEIVASYDLTEIPAGKCSLKQFIAFLMQHSQDPVTHSVENIAVQYNMDKKVVDDILKYFSVFVTKPIIYPYRDLEKPDDYEVQKVMDLALEKNQKDEERKQGIKDKEDKKDANKEINSR